MARTILISVVPTFTRSDSEANLKARGDASPQDRVIDSMLESMTPFGVTGLP